MSIPSESCGTCHRSKAPTQTDHHSPGQSIIEEAVAAIHSVFPNQDGPYHTVASLVTALESLCQKIGDEGRRLAACARKFVVFARAFGGYFDVLSLCLTVRPAWQDGLMRVLGSLFQVSIQLAPRCAHIKRTRPGVTILSFSKRLQTCWKPLHACCRRTSSCTKLADVGDPKARTPTNERQP